MVQRMASGGVVEAFVGARHDPQHGPVVLTWDNIVFARLPEDEMAGKMIYNPNMKIEDFIWDMDNSAIRQYVTGFLAGTWPPPPVEGESDDNHDGQTQQLCPVYPDR